MHIKVTTVRKHLTFYRFIKQEFKEETNYAKFI